MSEEKKWQSQLGKAVGYGLAWAALLIAHHYWDRFSTQSAVNTQAQNTKGEIESSKADTNQALAQLQEQMDIEKGKNAQLRQEADDRQRLINSLRLDVTELKKICGIKNFTDSTRGGGGL